MGDMDEGDGVGSGTVTVESSETKGQADSTQPGGEEEDITQADRSPSEGGNEAPHLLLSNSAAEVPESEQLSESDRALRKGSAGSHRSRHSSGGSGHRSRHSSGGSGHWSRHSSGGSGHRSRHSSGGSGHRSRHSSGGSSSSRKRSRSRSRHRSKHGDGVEGETSRPRSTSGKRSGSAGSRHSRHKNHETVTLLNGDKENTSTTEDEDNPACSVIHVESYLRKYSVEQPASLDKEGLGKDDKEIAKVGKRLMAEKLKYVTEKQLLKSKMEKAKKRFEDEVAKYETELDGKRQEYLAKFSELRLNEQYQALSRRMEELAGFREELDSRFLQCVEYEKEIEEIERYLDRRQELCNSKEEDLRLLDDQLDMLHQELELDKERLERAGFDVSNLAPRNRASSFKSPQKRAESDADDYILKANLRKCQSDLKKAEQTVQERDVEIVRVKEEILSLQSDKRKHKEKIKQLETQLAVALSQLKNQTNSAHPPSSVTLNRHASARSHVSLDRLKSPGELSINQQAQLNRSLSGKDRGGLSPAGKKYLRSNSWATNSSAATAKSNGEHSKGSSSEGAASEGDATHEFQMGLAEGTGKIQPRTVSSACAVM